MNIVSACLAFQACNMIKDMYKSSMISIAVVVSRQGNLKCLYYVQMLRQIFQHVEKNRSLESLLTPPKVCLLYTRSLSEVYLFLSYPCHFKKKSLPNVILSNGIFSPNDLFNIMICIGPNVLDFLFCSITTESIDFYF